ncbi:nucleotidyltransferase family protein [Terribacillus sp. DMT04]|uniref:nucleotidyltransferase family protein n=1 Tax=Terribacillus sp. DMT04 TaxID=2850441 RepID=UPI001C2BB104|nr:nucleotidyltransferase family protein [Terribacillus sp. DMT04]QXE02638.1 nucleotidyltransferase family protein [Terribacillus sp. DMT04]
MSQGSIQADQLQTEADLLEAIKQDKWMMLVLETAAKLELPDCCISAGFVRAKAWDVQHGYIERTPLTDVDVVYFDAADINKAIEKELENMLIKMMPSVPWSVKNQARMHHINQMPAFRNTAHAIACYPETATSIGVKLEEGTLQLIAPYGIDDLLACRIAPTPPYVRSEAYHSIYLDRVNKKNWQRLWPRVQMEESAI